MQDDAPSQPGPAVRGYRIERLIGTGGAAAVYEARRLGRGGPGGPMIRVACKVMHAQRRDDPGRLALAWQEAVLGLRVTAGHPNLAQVLDFFDDATEQLCIVMELVDGASVAELRGPELRLPFPVTRRIAVDVLEALVHLHGRSVLHRDLSLRNVLVTAGGAVKVTDFGIARVMEQGQVHTDNCRGTPMYLSPEAIQSHALDERADLFSLGAVLYDLVAGAPPCGNQSMVGAMFARNLVGVFAPLPPDTPEDLAELITGLIRPDRDARRPRTAAEALALLRGCDQPLASPEELAALIGAARSRRDQELADHRPAHVLEPGHVLAPRMTGVPPERKAGALPERGADAPLERQADAPPERGAGGAADALSGRVAQIAADAPPARVIGDGADVLPDLVAELAADAVPEHVTDAPPEHMARRPSGSMVQARLRGVGRFLVRRAVAVAAIVACVLVLGSLLHDGFQGEQPAVEPQQRPDVPAPVAEPTPAPLVAPASMTSSEPRPVTDRADGPHFEPIEMQGSIQRPRPSAPRWRTVPHASEPPPWGLR
jgi:hypothetical protein